MKDNSKRKERHVAKFQNSPEISTFHTPVVAVHVLSPVADMIAFCACSADQRCAKLQLKAQNALRDGCGCRVR